jgi:hypothetical protein
VSLVFLVVKIPSSAPRRADDQSGFVVQTPPAVAHSDMVGDWLVL